MRQTRWLTVALLACGGAVMALVVVAASLAAGQPPSIYAYLGTGYVYGFASAGNVPVTITLANAGGIKAQVTVTSSTNISLTGLYAATLPAVIQSGDWLTVTAQDVSTGMTVASLTARANRTAGTVTGQAPPDSPLEVTLEQPGVTYRQFVTSTTGGSFSASFAGQTSIVAGDWGSVTYTPTVMTNTVSVQLYRVPLLRFYLGSDRVDGYTVAGDLPITLTRSGEAITLTSSHDSFSYGQFVAYFAGGAVRIGDRVTMTAGSELPIPATVQALTVNMDSAANSLHGDGPGPNVPVWVEFNQPQATYTRIVTTSNATPYTFTAVFTASMSPGDWGRASVSDPNGNLTYAYTRLPIVYAYKGNRHVFGYAASGGLPVTVTLKNSSGITQAMAFLVSSSDVYAWGYFAADLRDSITNAPIVMQSGDVVETKVGPTSHLTMTVRSLDGQVDPVANAVKGNTLPNSNVRAVLYHWIGSGYDNGTEQVGQADATGNYTVSFASLVAAQLGDYALVYRPDGQSGVTYALAPSTHPSLAVTGFPAHVDPNATIPVTWTIAGGVHTTYANVHWDTVSRAASYSYNHSTPVQIGGPGTYVETLPGVQLGRVYFRARAFVDGQELWSGVEQAIEVGWSMYLPIVVR